MPNFTAGTSFSDGVTNDVTAAKLNALVADAVPTSNLALTSTNGTIANFTSSTANITLGTIPTLTAGTTTSTNDVVTNGTITNLSATTSTLLGTITGSTNVINIGSGQIYKDASGNVGIGITPSQKLDVNGASAIRGTLFLGDGSSSVIRKLTSSTPLTFANNGGSAEMTIDSSGNVGIGTASPSGPLHIRGATGRYAFPATSGATQSNGLTLRLNDASDDNAILDIGGNSTSGYWLQATNNANLATNYPLLLNPNGGNVGIGTTSPSQKLDIQSAIASVQIKSTTATNSAILKIENNSTAYIGNEASSGNSTFLGTTAYATCLGNTGAYPVQLATNNNVRMTIDSSGNVGIGTASPATKLTVSGSSGTGSELRVVSTTANTGGKVTLYENTSACWEISAPSGANGPFTVRDIFNNQERLRIDSSGNLLVGTTSGAIHRIVKSSASDFAFQVSNTSSSTPYVQALTFASAAPNDSTSMFLRCDDTGQTGRIQLRSNGGLANYSANNVNLSDERLKQDIQASPSYLDKICSIPVVNFKYKDQTHSDYNLGVIAQRVEAVCPELVDVDGFGETPNDGIPLKSIYQTDLQYALMKCIQELKSENDSLKTRIEALEAA